MHPELAMPRACWNSAAPGISPRTMPHTWSSPSEIPARLYLRSAFFRPCLVRQVAGLPCAESIGGSPGILRGTRAQDIRVRGLWWYETANVLHMAESEKMAALHSNLFRAPSSSRHQCYDRFIIRIVSYAHPHDRSRRQAGPYIFHITRSACEYLGLSHPGRGDNTLCALDPYPFRSLNRRVSDGVRKTLKST